MNSKTKKLVFSALLAALVCVATLVIRVPSPFHGYINTGDCFVLLSGWVLGPIYGFAAAGIGSVLADLFAGYAAYAPASFFIKGLMALAAYFVLKAFGKLRVKAIGYAASGFAAGALMVLGYYAFEGFLYDFTAAAVNIVPNIIQAAAGVAAGTALKAALDKSALKI